MEKRLRKNALASTRYCMDSMKAESVNRQSSKNVPKSGNWIETLPGRFSTTVHSSNNGVAFSIVKRRAAAGTALSPMSPTVKVLESIERDGLYGREYRNEPECKHTALANRIRRFKTDDELKEMGTYKSGDVPSAEKKRRKVEVVMEDQHKPQLVIWQKGDIFTVLTRRVHIQARKQRAHTRGGEVDPAVAASEG
ncbi:Hypp595 [Branchiostoma lanceolatum]|uniref:Hypp595 protein n=1 Tax=Branchiostoma lanceolatum TaxID=7740 RepID=A0A8J9VVR1_BRALA|nr:Hypp595 [Branchiostoma lanceolatum]